MQVRIMKQWNKNKDKLQDWFRHNDTSSLSYKDILQQVIELVISGYNSKSITAIDDGSYQGTLVFVIPAQCYAPNITDYLFTYVYYGSCSGCDTLQAIQWGHLDKEQEVEDYMTLALHMVQRLKSYSDFL